MFDGVKQQSRSAFAPITALSFSAKQEQDCLEYLQKRSANTEIVTLSDDAQLRLAADGRLVESGYRFNLLGFLAVSRAICGGLSRVFGEVSGLMSSKLSDPDNCSIPAAVGIYNTALRIRFETLRERSVLVDHANRSIDGFLGLNHKLLDNAVFLDIILTAMREHDAQLQFYRAELVGRELRVYVIDPRSRRTDIYLPDHVFSSGWYFCNREDSGNSVKALPCLYTKYGVAMSAVDNRKRVVHVGADLTGRTADLVRSVYHRQIDMELLRQRVAALDGQTLGIDGKASLSENIKKWSGYLTRFGVPREMSSAIAKNAIHVGKDLQPRDPLDVFTDKVLASRTAYDLVCSVIRYARNLPSGHREKIQEVGMKLLLPPKPKKGSK